MTRQPLNIWCLEFALQRINPYNVQCNGSLKTRDYHVSVIFYAGVDQLPTKSVVSAKVQDESVSFFEGLLLMESPVSDPKPVNDTSV